MKTKGLVPGAVVVGCLVSACASTGPAKKPEWQSVKVVTERDVVRGCELVEVIRGDNLEDIRRQAAKKGDTALVTGQTGIDLPWVIAGPFGKGIKTGAEVYRCGVR